MPPPERRLAAPAWLARAGTISWLTLGILALGTVLVVALSVFSAILFPVLYAAVATILAIPLVDRLERLRLSRTIGALLALLLVVGVVVGAVSLVTWSVIDQQDQIVAALDTVADELTVLAASLGLDTAALTSLTESLMEAVQAVGSSGAGLASSLVDVASSAVAAVIGIFFGLVFLFFMLRDGHEMVAWARRGLTRGVRFHADLAGSSAIEAIRRYFGGRAVVAAVDAVLIGSGALVLGVPLVPAIVVLTFLGGFVPYIGAFVAGTLAVVLAFAANGLHSAVLMLVVVLVVQNAIEPLVEARVLGASLGLHPMVVMVVTTLGGIAVGFTGLVLAAPTTAAVVRIVRGLREHHASTSTDAIAG